MTYLGNTDIDVYPLCLGTNPFGWTASAQDSFAVLDAYTAGGGNFIDTADTYSSWVEGNSGGESETIIGQWMSERGNRHNLVLATKVAKWEGARGLSAAAIQRGIAESLRRLQTDYVDLYYAHAEDLSVDIEETVSAFAQLQQEGKIRAVGLSNHSPERIREWIETAERLGVPKPVALQPHYNLVYRADFEGKYRDLAAEYDLSVAPYYSLASGLLTGKYKQAADIAGPRAGTVSGYASEAAFRVVEAVRGIAASHNVEVSSIAIAWLLAQPTVIAPIASARVAEQVPALLEGASVVLSAEELQELNDLSADC